MLKVELFGPGRASFNGQPIANFPNQQSYLILCYLLLNSRHPQHRDQLAAVFWGDYSAQASRKYLRNSLWRLRQCLETLGAASDDYLLVSDDSIAFVSSSPFWVDIDAFESSAARFQDLEGEDLTADQAAQLEQAVELYQGDLLEGIYEDWCLYDRERLNLLYTSSLAKLTNFHASQGQYERALAYGKRILSRDSTREKVHLLMMRLYWLSGDRQAALAQYRRCAQALHEELNIQPMKETTQVYQQMLQNQYEAAPRRRQILLPSALPASGPVTGDNSRSLSEHVLSKLHHLQAILEETQAEIQRLEALINR